MKQTRIFCIALLALILCIAMVACDHKDNEHVASGNWLTNETHHWQGCVDGCEGAEVYKDEHTYTNACDTSCDVCGYARTVEAHAYDNACDNKCNVCETLREVEPHAYDNTCDTKCNVCEAEREVGPHTYDNACDSKCNVCEAVREVEPHAYDNACDASCNECGVAREITHKYADTVTVGETAHWYACSVCGDKKNETAHTFDKTVATSDYLKAEATTTTKAQYWKSCVCGAKSATEYFEIDKKTATLSNIQDLSKTYDKVELQNPTYTTNSDGAVTFEWYKGTEKLSAKPTAAGTYKVKVIIAESVTYTGVSAEKEFTIAKKVLSNLAFSVVYNGRTYHGEVAVPSGVVAGDEFLVDIDLYNKNVGTYTCHDGTDKDTSICWEDISYGGADYENYEIDRATTTVTVTPKVLYNVELHVTYAKTKAFSNVAVPVSAGVAEGDDYKVGIDLLGVKAGEYTIANELLEDIYPETCEDADNYSIDRATVKVVVDKRELKAVIYNFIYGQYFKGDSYASGECPIAYQLKTTHNVFEGDTVYMSTTFESRNAGAAVLSQGIFGADVENYTLPEDVLVDIKITPRFMTVPNTISKEYDGNGHFSYTYPASQGAYGEVVTVEFDIESGAIGAYANAKISNLKFYVGGVETTNYTWSKDTINAFINNGEFSEAGTLSVGADFTKGLYTLTLTESGLYSFKGSENFFTVDGIYNQYGNTIALDGLTFAATPGTYLVEISKTSSISSSGATVSLEKESISFANEKLFDCQQAEEKTLTLTKGEFLCLKVMGGENSLMSDLYINVPDGSNASFFAMEYALDQTECYWIYQNVENGVGIPWDHYYMDVCETSDLYIVLYAVTSGDIIVTVD